MEYRYHVSYAYEDKTKTGFGCIPMIRSQPITDEENVEMVRDYIKNLHEFSSVVILSWQKYEEPSVPKSEGE